MWKKLLVVFAATQLVILVFLQMRVQSEWHEFLRCVSELRVKKGVQIYPMERIDRETFDSVRGNTITPGFVEGYIRGHYGRIVNVRTTYLRANGTWVLEADYNDNRVIASDSNLSVACFILLERCSNDEAGG